MTVDLYSILLREYNEDDSLSFTRAVNLSRSIHDQMPRRTASTSGGCTGLPSTVMLPTTSTVSLSQDYGGSLLYDNMFATFVPVYVKRMEVVRP